MVMAAPNSSVISAMDSLSAAIKCHIIPNQEYLLQGSILDSAVEHLLHRCVFYFLSFWNVYKQFLQLPWGRGVYYGIHYIHDIYMIFFVFRLKGLCDNVDSGPEPFHDHEVCFSLRAPNQTVSELDAI